MNDHRHYCLMHHERHRSREKRVERKKLRRKSREEKVEMTPRLRGIKSCLRLSCLYHACSVIQAVRIRAIQLDRKREESSLDTLVISMALYQSFPLTSPFCLMSCLVFYYSTQGVWQINIEGRGRGRGVASGTQQLVNVHVWCRAQIDPTQALI